MILTTAAEARVGVCKALGLDPSRVRSLTLTMKPDEMVTVEVVELLDSTRIDSFREVVSRYELRRRE